MSKVIVFSRVFPAYHPKAGQPTNFVEKLLRSFCTDFDLNGDTINEYFDCYCELSFDLQLKGLLDVLPKYHTIRAGNRFKVGDKFSPRVWSGKPYRSKQIIIAPDIEVKKVFGFEIKESEISAVHTDLFVDGKRINADKHPTLTEVSKNDGLDASDFLDWFQFPKPFSGQVICWNSEINY